jgi:hypothetical protein
MTRPAHLAEAQAESNPLWQSYLLVELTAPVLSQTS